MRANDSLDPLAKLTKQLPQPSAGRFRTPKVMRSLHNGVRCLLKLVFPEMTAPNILTPHQFSDNRLRGNRMTEVVKRISASPQYSPSLNSWAPYGYFCGRPIIGDGTPIAGGIYIGSEPQEALVIDDKYEALQRVYKDFRGRLAGVIKHKSIDEHRLLSFTMRHVNSLLSLDETRVAKLNHLVGGKKDRKVALDSFLNAGYAAPRHMVLLAGFMLENCIRECLIRGTLSLDTHTKTERLIYTGSSGDIFVIDFTTNKLEAGH